MSESHPHLPRLAPAAVTSTPLPGGGMVLRSPVPLGPYPASLGEHLRRWAREAPGRTFLAERDAAGGWRRVTYAEALAQVERIAQGLLDRGLGAGRAVMVLSENSVDHALLQLACLYVGVTVAPVSPAYSLVSRDHGKLRFVFDLVRPAMVYAASGARFAPALRALALGGVEVVVSADPPEGIPATRFADLGATPGPAVAAAFGRVGPDTVAKILFTSGSTDMPKGVLNTQRMLCANQQMMAQTWLFLEDRPPVLLDWLPWHHTFGGNHNFNAILRNGGTLYIDAGKPMPGAVEVTVANLREVSPTLSFNVPRGYEVLLPYLEADAGLRDAFFRELDMVFYAAAALPQPLWERLERLALASRGRPVFMASSWGATETAPMITAVHFFIERAGVIGLPAPGAEVKFVPNGSKLEMRVRGPNITPGYYRRDDLTAAAFDEEGYYLTGDAGRLADPADPARGVVFDGRVSEDFKLTTGTWVHVGGLRLGVLEAVSPLLQDAVVAGHNRDYIGLLAWPNPAEAAAQTRPSAADPAVLTAAPELAERLRRALQARNAAQGGSATRVRRLLLMAEPPGLDANEITDKGYVNQRAVLEGRAALVERLFAEPPGEDVIVL
ncbi:MAG: feruloyl-CoA synthase [Deferrisomatales bacterium]